LKPRIAFLVESYGEPWNEGYKNLVKYIIEMIGNRAQTNVFTTSSAKNAVFKNFDLLYLFNQEIGPLTFLKILASRKPVLKHVAKKETDVNLIETTKTHLYSRFLWKAISTTTSTLKNDLQRLTHKKSIFYLPPPISIDYFSKLNKEECREELGLSKERIYVAYTGRLNSYRKMELIFSALRSINQPNVQLLLSITDQDEKQKRLLGTQINTLGTNSPKKVKFVNASDIRYLYASSDILLYPVDRKGAVEPPLTVLEAMSCSCVVAAFRTPAVQSLIKEYENGFLFSNSEELSQLIDLLSTRSLDTETIGENARKTIVENFSARNLISLYLGAFREILNEYS
jgi:glycosyltransferase involved in cell wall biosynthesis